MARVIPITRSTFRRCFDPLMGIEPTSHRQQGFDKSAGLQIWTAQRPSRSEGEGHVGPESFPSPAPISSRPLYSRAATDVCETTGTDGQHTE